jgi:hypothetical protein
VDLDRLHPGNEASLTLQDKAGNDEERRAYRQFVHDLVRIQMTRTDTGAPEAVCRFYDVPQAPPLGSRPDRGLAPPRKGEAK